MTAIAGRIVWLSLKVAFLEAATLVLIVVMSIIHVMAFAVAWTLIGFYRISAALSKRSGRVRRQGFPPFPLPPAQL